ncbi:MAG: RuvB-like helicase, partial [Thermoproteales archaeon]|nr:RuvB-like helicase [Thermoproteales archaeon]
DDVHMLDIEAFSFLSRAMESELAPIIILASNRGFTKIRGTDIVSPHGLPRDLLDRLLIIKTRQYTREEIKEILKIRAKEDKIELSEDALEKLADYGVKESLRYAAQLMIPAKIIAQRENKSKVDVVAVEEAAKLFLSMSGSAKYLREMEEAFLK